MIVKRGEWWRSRAGAIYCAIGVVWGAQGGSARAEVFWITGHTRPQVHRVKLLAAQWRSLTRTGERLPSPPVVNTNGADIAGQVADALARLAAEDAP